MTQPDYWYVCTICGRVVPCRRHPSADARRLYEGLSESFDWTQLDDVDVDFYGPCTCDHIEAAHGWMRCDVEGCHCAAGWTPDSTVKGDQDAGGDGPG